MRVLVVESDFNIAQRIVRTVRDETGFAVDVSHDGDDALLLCTKYNYDLVLIDLIILVRRGVRHQGASREKLSRTNPCHCGHK